MTGKTQLAIMKGELRTEQTRLDLANRRDSDPENDALLAARNQGNSRISLLIVVLILLLVSFALMLSLAYL